MRRQPSGISPHEEQIGNESVTIGQGKAAFLPDGKKITHVLHRADAPRGSVDDDADPPVRHT
jgi:hypothetical protein